MKTIKKTLAVAALVVAAPMAAQAVEISGNVSLASDYVWRGVSQTGNVGAISGGFDVEGSLSESVGVYAGVWGSNVDFDSDTSIELDYYGGVTFAATEDLSFDLGLINYTYPDESNLNFTEVYLTGSYAGFSLGYSYDEDNSNGYTSVGYDVDLSEGVALSLGYGHYDFDDSEDYDNWLVSVSKSFFGVDFALTYTDTDIDKDDCDDECNDIVAISMSKSL